MKKFWRIYLLPILMFVLGSILVLTLTLLLPEKSQNEVVIVTTYVILEYPEEVVEKELEFQEDYGLLEPSGLSVEELESRLYAPLSEYAEYFIEAEQETGVNAIFLSSVAALESGWGKSKVAENKNNLYGWTTDSGEYKVFSSEEECIKFIARKFKELYLSPDGRYFTGYEVEDINYYYNGRPEWAEAVNNIMDIIGDDN